MKLTLLVLAAGMGSRYGGLKQLDEVGPSGETVMDYSVFDAMRAGFDRVVFVIRKDIEEAFRAAIGSRYADRIEVAYAFQDMNDLPAGFRVPEGRTKPWGTGQAVYAARKLLDGPFAVINADDFYGADSYRKLAGYLKSAPEDGKIRGCIASFVLSNTLSEDGKVISVQEDGAELEFTGEELVSMNSWGFMPELVGELERLFTGFLEEHGTELKSEFYLPFAVDTLIREGRAEIKMLKSEDSWFGITYREDKPFVQAALRKLVAEGAYPEKLFK